LATNETISFLEYKELIKKSIISVVFLDKNSKKPLEKRNRMRDNMKVM
jgi:hypothetical protein